MSFGRGLRLFLGFILVVPLVLLMLGAGYLLLAAVPAPVHLERKGELLRADVTGEFRLSQSTVTEYRLESSSGLVIDIALRRPDTSLPHRPLLVLMGGQETGRAAVEVIPDTRGVTLAAISYPFGTVPHRDLVQVALALPRIQRGIFDTPAAALLALDYLLSAEAGIGSGQVELAGISFGAYLAPVPAALDPRIQRLWLIHGGGAPADVLAHGLRKRISLPGLRHGVASYLATVVGAGHMSPEGWLGRLPPRPLVLVHASEDDDLPPVAISALHNAAAGGPVEVLWTPGKHVHPKRPAVIQAISDLMFTRIASATSLP